MFYSKTTKGFYDPTIHGANIPPDAVEITDQQHADLLNGQSAGKVITSDANGNPELTDPPAPTTDQLAAAARQKRDGLITAIQWRLSRYENQMAQGISPNDTADQYKAVLVYVQALRDLTKQAGFPATITWPTISA